MKPDRYELKAGKNLTTFEFLSEGKKGKVVKMIEFRQMNIEHLFNLAFGDKNVDSGELDDYVITDNGDTEKVLATVVAALYSFADRYPDIWVYATGSTRARSRLYRKGIDKYFGIVAADFDIMGEYQNEWEWYKPGKNYGAFAVRRKRVNLNNENDV